ncbi:MAG TPA: YjbH domain-containing protein [Rhizomicrobium sp.]|nr:YjbH domain-containing protein [Rhizomicrobium sp.]
MGKVARRAQPFFVTCAILLAARPALADDAGPVLRDNYGSVGLIDMPNARMAPDGEFAISASFLRNNQHYNVTLQALPWLEAAFRYSGLQRYDPGYPVYYDRSFAVKARLWDESSVFPAVSVGINDLIGTGIYGGEYVVASKNFGPLDATLGMGWGRLASTDLFKNPFAQISHSFAPRALQHAVTTPGSANFSAFFHGEYSGLFGGVQYRTPVEGLSLAVEYSSDTYAVETTNGNFKPKSQLNVAASYAVTDNTVLRLGWMYGTTINGSISFALDPVTDPFPQHINDAPFPPVRLRTPAEQQQALDNLLRLRQAQPAGYFAFSASGLNALSDALFAEIAGLTDVSARGRTLALTVDRADLPSVCANAASLVARYNVDLDGVTTDGPRGRSTRCPMQRRGAGALVNAALIQNPGSVVADHNGLAAGALITIDASGESDPQNAIAAIKADAAVQKLSIEGISLAGGEAIVYYSNLRYPHEDDAADRLVRVLLKDTPPDIEKFRLLATLDGIPLAEFDVLRGPTERDIAQTGKYSLLADGNTLGDAPLQNPVLTEAARGTYPRFSWRLFPQFRQELFDPDNPFAVQFLAGALGVAELRPGLSAVAEVEASVYDNFNLRRESDSALPHVRTDWTRFFTDGKDGVGQLELDYLTRLAPDLYAQARIGYLESMYAGVGGEVLWHPHDQRWALGADLYGVQERAFNRQFGLQPYTTVTGHATLYYQSPWYGLNFQLRVGQYLARDRGFTFQVTRRFSTGVELGAFFTKTNVSAAQFGEGSFDKGFLIRIPLGWTMPVTTQGAFSTIIRPVQRDGGQALDSDANLYNYLLRTGTGDILAHADDFTGNNIETEQ